MKTIASLLFILLLPTAASAANTFLDVATGAPGTSPYDGVDQASNPVSVWTLGAPGDGSQGAFGAAGGTVWALYSNTAQAVANSNGSNFGGALGIGQTVSLSFANQGIDSGNQVGINLTSGGTTEFSLFFLGGGIGSYQYTDNLGTFNTGVGYTTDSNTLSLTLTSASTYSASFGAASWTGTLATPSIDGVSVFDNGQSGNDVFFDNLSVQGSEVVPEPSQTALILAGGLLLLIRVVGKRNKSAQAAR